MQPALNFRGLWMDSVDQLIRVTHWNTDHWIGVVLSNGEEKFYDSDGLSFSDNTKLVQRRRGEEKL